MKGEVTQVMTQLKKEEACEEDLLDNSGSKVLWGGDQRNTEQGLL